MPNTAAMVERDNDGKFKGNGSPDTIYNAMEPGEPHTTGELVDTTSIPERTVRHYLNKLTDAGRVRKKKLNPRQAIWIRPQGDDDD